MAKCTETCPKCGAGRTQFEGQTSWECGSYSMYVPGLNPFWAIAQSKHCKARQELTALRTELADAKHTIARVSFYAGQSTGEIRMLKQRVAELEEALKLWMTYDGMGNPDPLSILLMARNATATLLRITRIPGKEDDDGEMH